MLIFAYIDATGVIQTLALCESSTVAAQQIAALGYSRAEDVTSMDPRPQPGWVWVSGTDPVSGSLPDDPPPRVIPHLELIERFTADEWEALATHTAAAAVAFRTKIQACGNVWLGDPRLIAALDKMVTAGILTADRPEEILA